MRFKPNVQNIKTFISKLWHRFQQNLHNNLDHQVLFVGCPNTRTTNPRQQTAAILTCISFNADGSRDAASRPINHDAVHGDCKRFKQHSKSDLQTHSRLLAILLFDKPYVISY